jgi:hypothetical protein
VLAPPSSYSQVRLTRRAPSKGSCFPSDPAFVRSRQVFHGPGTPDRAFGFADGPGGQCILPGCLALRPALPTWVFLQGLEQRHSVATGSMCAPERAHCCLGRRCRRCRAAASAHLSLSLVARLDGSRCCSCQSASRPRQTGRRQLSLGLRIHKARGPRARPDAAAACEQTFARSRLAGGGSRAGPGERAAGSEV